MPTAHQVFDEMLRSGIRPPLQALGFGGSGSTFTWPAPNAIAHLGFQKSQLSNDGAVKFTVNVTVADRSKWDLLRQTRPHLPEEPLPNTRYAKEIWQRRIDRLIPDERHRWWWVEADGNWMGVANEVVEAITAYVVPVLRKRTTTLS
jgi:hypothetical protein